MQVGDSLTHKLHSVGFQNVEITAGSAILIGFRFKLPLVYRRLPNNNQIAVWMINFLPISIWRPLMTFFDENKLQPRKIEIDSNAISCDSPEVTKRLDRITDNYQQLDLILADVESKIQGDERLRAIDQSIKDVEAEEKKKKRKWRPSKASGKSRRKSANPKKPR